MSAFSPTHKKNLLNSNKTPTPPLTGPSTSKEANNQDEIQEIKSAPLKIIKQSDSNANHRETTVFTQHQELNSSLNQENKTNTKI